MLKLKYVGVVFLILSVLFVGLVACSSMNATQPIYNERSDFVDDGIMNNVEATSVALVGTPRPMPTAIASGEQQDLTSVEPQESQRRIVIMNATIRLVVENAEIAVEQATQMVEAMGGWIVSSSARQATTSANEEVTRASMTIRVPADRLNEALDQLKSGAISVEEENVTGQDVTRDYVDLSSRLGNLEAAEQQLQEIMDGARRTEDVLSVYSELVRVRGEIESIRGQMTYYDEASTFSAINIEFIPDAIANPPRIEIAGWSPGNTAENAIGALVDILRFLVDAVITIIIIGLPLLLLVGLPAWFIFRRFRPRIRVPAGETRTE